MAQDPNSRALQDIAKELHEMNKRLDKLCRASIFLNELIACKDERDSQEKQSL